MSLWICLCFVFSVVSSAWSAFLFPGFVFFFSPDFNDSFFFFQLTCGGLGSYFFFFWRLFFFYVCFVFSELGSPHRLVEEFFMELPLTSLPGEWYGLRYCYK